jgi:1-acyl-sn-glycerol-3-phosphate acyltransferase
MVNTLRAYMKMSAIFLHIGGFVGVCFLRNMFFGQDTHWTLRRRQKLVYVLFRILKIELTVNGTPPDESVIFVANHRSYLDPIVMHRDLLFLPVAKSEVAKWPLIGYGVKITGTLFVERENKQSRRKTREAMLEAINQDFSVCIYPEGTTHIQPQTIAFKKGTFINAAKHKLPIVPVAIDYEDLSVAWIGEDTFLPHLLDLCKKKQIKAKIAIGPTYMNEDHEVLLKDSQTWIDRELRGEKEEALLY